MTSDKNASVTYAYLGFTYRFRVGRYLKAFEWQKLPGHPDLHTVALRIWLPLD
jgi:hypothetical protein